MKYYFLSGNNNLLLEQKISDLKSKAKKRNYSLQELEYQEGSLISRLRAKSLFRKKDLFLIKLQNDLSAKDIEYLLINRDKYDLTVVFYKYGKLSEKTVAKLRSLSKFEKYDLPKLVFKFLDSFYPGNVLSCLKLWTEVKKNEEPIFLLNLLSGHLKSLYLFKIKGNLENYPPWRQFKIKSQAAKFEVDQLKDILGHLAKLDILSKSTKEDVIGLLDLLIIQKLE